MDMNVKYHNLLADVTQSIVASSYKQICLWATVLIQHRLEGMDDWTIEQTRGIPQTLVNEIFVFAKSEAEKEEQKTPEDKAAEEAELEESLGKLRTALTEVRDLQIGEPSTGNASTTGRGGKSSTPKTSRAKSATTSKKPSVRARNSTAKSSTTKKSA